MIRIPVFYSEMLVVNDGDLWSPSALKPKALAAELNKRNLPVNFIEPKAINKDLFYLVHDKDFVDDILACRIENGFGTISKTVANSLPYTTGAMLEAALMATVKVPSVALVSGFHHAGYQKAQMFCTFNGLMVSAIYLQTKFQKRVAILDADYHFGNGTENILNELNLNNEIWHFSFGKQYRHQNQALEYLQKIKELEGSLNLFKPDLIIYQAGADVHLNDPLGGLLSDNQIFERDFLVFEMAKRLNTPICWNLAGGYQRDKEKTIQSVLDIHINTFLAAIKVYDLG